MGKYAKQLQAEDTEALLAAIYGDDEELDRLLSEMNMTGLRALGVAARWVYNATIDEARSRESS